MHRIWLWLIVLWMASSCREVPSALDAGSSADARSEDAAAADGRPANGEPDAGLVDAGVVFDGAPADVWQPDGTPPDAALSDMETADAVQPDVTAPDALPPDAAPPPDATMPDAAPPDAVPPPDPAGCVAEGCADLRCADVPACRSTVCRMPGGCAERGCWTHPVCCADEDLGDAVGLDLVAPTTGRLDGPGRQDGGLDRWAGSCVGVNSQEMTVAWTAPAAGTYVFDVNGPFGDGRMRPRPSIYALGGCAGPELACAQAPDARYLRNPGRLQLALDAGESVLLVLDDVGGWALQPPLAPYAVLSILPLETPLPCVDDCADGCGPACACVEYPIGFAMGLDRARLRLRGASSRAGSCGGAGAEDTLLWTAPADGRYTFAARAVDIEGEAPLDPVLYLMPACDRPEIACAAAVDGRATVSVDMAAGDGVVVVVDSAEPDREGTVALSITGAEEICRGGYDEDGDGAVDCDDPDCAGSPGCACDPIDVGSALGRWFSGPVVAGPHRYTASCGAADSPDVTFAWTAPADGRYTIEDGWHSRTALVDGCGGDELACNGRDRGVAFDAAAGETVIIITDGLGAPNWPDSGRHRFVVHSATELHCADGLDDDGDRARDCDDVDCADDPACAPRCLADGCIDAACADDPLCLAARCRSEGGCADPACAVHPVCCAGLDIGSATGVDVAAGVNAERDPRWGYCGGNFAGQRTIAWTPPANGNWVITTESGDPLDPQAPQLDTVLSLVVRCDQAGFECNADALPGARGSRLHQHTGPSRTLMFIVDGGVPGAEAPFALSITPSAFDWGFTDCADRTGHGPASCESPLCDAHCGCADETLGVAPGPDLWRGQPQADDVQSACGGAGPDHMVQWIAPATGLWRFRVEAEGDAAPVVGVFEYRCAAEEALACASGLPGAAAEAVHPLEAGALVRIAIDADGEPDALSLGIFAEDETAFCGDGRDDDGDGAVDCADADCAADGICACVAVDLGRAVGPAVFRGTNAGRGHRVTPSCGSDAVPDARLAWTAPADGRYRFTADGDLDPVLAVVDADCAAERACAANDALELDLTAGEQVVLVVEGQPGRARSKGVFTVGIEAL